jgi:hypothetical protein
MKNNSINTTIDEVGFLSEEINQWIDKNKIENKDIFDLIHQYNKFAQSIMFEIEAHDNNAQELLIATLFVRSLSTFQASIILIERCLEFESKILIRSLMEIMFALVACSKDKKIADDYILNENIDRLKSIRRLKNNKSVIKGLLDIDDMLKMESKLESEINESNVSRLSVEELSRKSGLHKNYLIVYDVLSKSVHSTARDLSELLDLEKKIFIQMGS